MRVFTGIKLTGNSHEVKLRVTKEGYACLLGVQRSNLSVYEMQGTSDPSLSHIRSKEE
jgi:hypothetical protein